MPKEFDQFADEAKLKIKSWWKSSTIWLASAMIFVENMGHVIPALGLDVHPVLRAVLVNGVAIAIIFNRLYGTRQAITVSAAQKPIIADKTVPMVDSNHSGA